MNNLFVRFSGDFFPNLSLNVKLSDSLKLDANVWLHTQYHIFKKNVFIYPRDGSEIKQLHQN